MIRYLESIQSGKSINYPAFVRKASSYGFSESVIRACFKVSKDTKKKGNFYFLEIKNNDLYIANFSRFFEVNENKKVELSVHGNSKKAKSDFSHLLIKLNHYDVVPWVVVFDKNEYKYLFKEKLKKKIIIIENEDSFGNLEQSFHNEQLDLSEFNFILGFGNYITDRNFREFLNSYDHVICFLDIDLGGLKTFASLKANLSSKTTFYFSNKMEDYLRAYGNEIGDKAYLQALSFINSPGLDQVVKAIKQHKKFAEQEIFQH